MFLTSDMWWERVKNITSKALKEGHLMKLETKIEELEENKLKWYIRIISTLNKKPVNNKNEKNPFLPYDPHLFISTVFETHNLLLNKFSVVDYHLLLTTINFESQLDKLNQKDFKALWFIIKTFHSLGFYNCGKNSGASQPHKHLQIIPLPFESKIPGIDFPTEKLLYLNFNKKKNKYINDDNEIFQIEEWSFKHLCLKLNQENLQQENYSKYLEDCYSYLYNLLNLDECDNNSLENIKISYNFIITEKWMILVPRKFEKIGNISVNSIGFTGTFLVKAEEDLRKLKELGIYKIYQLITFS